MSLESLCLIHGQQGPASPAARTRQCSQRMAHWTRDGSEGVQLYVILRLGLNSGFFWCCHGFFLWLGSWRARRRRRLGPATQRHWAAKRSACPRRTRGLCAVLSLTRFAVGAALSIDSGLRAPPGSPATPWGVTAGGPAPPESHRSARRSAPHTIRLLSEAGSSFCRLPCIHTLLFTNEVLPLSWHNHTFSATSTEPGAGKNVIVTWSLPRGGAGI